MNAPQNNSTLLHLAAAEGRLNCVQVLLEHKANIRARVSGPHGLREEKHNNICAFVLYIQQTGTNITNH